MMADAKLSAESAGEIRARHASGERVVALAHELGVSESTISRIINGQAYPTEGAERATPKQRRRRWMDRPSEPITSAVERVQAAQLADALSRVLKRLIWNDDEGYYVDDEADPEAVKADVLAARRLLARYRQDQQDQQAQNTPGSSPTR